ncbi:MAG: TonB-dependent receptor, partial [Acidobacteria bacterium]|nr:TonB-dependent receptor [Acidobacteriota bacterium]
MTWRSRFRNPSLALLWIALTGVTAAAQGPTTGSITGTVVDNTGAVLPGVSVSATSSALIGEQTAITNAQGQYRFPSLPPGTYTLKFELSGFATVIREGIRVNIGFMADLHIAMQLATLQENITVRGESPVVDTQNTTVTNNFTAEMLRSIPNARDIWSLIAEAPGMTVGRFDVGGSTAGTQTGYTAYGSSGQNRVQVDGANTTEGTAAAGFYFDYGAFEEISFGASNAADAQMPTPGVMINSVIKSGGNTVHGDLYFDYENESLQGNNVTPELARLGVGQGTRMVKYFDPNFNVGGPIKKDRFWYFTSFRNQDILTTTTGWPFDAPGTGPDFLTRLQNITYKLTYQLNQNNKISHFLQWGRKFQPYRNASATTSLDGVYKQDSYSWAGKVEWNRIVGPSFFFDARASTFAYNWPNLPYKPDMEVGPRDQIAYRRTDQITGNTAGGYSGYRYDRRRYQGEVVANLFRDAWLGANHSIKFGLLSEWEQIEDEEFGNRESVLLTFRSTSGVDFTTPFRVTLQNGPTTYTDALWHYGAFVQDQVIVNPHLTLNLGMRWDYYNAYEPEQVVREAPYRDFFYAGAPLGSVASPFPRADFAGSWKIPKRTGIILLKDTLAPRIGAAYDLKGNGRTVVKANWGRFFNNPGVSYSDDVNPIQWATATYGWNDRNGDRLFTLNELGAFVNSSGGVVNSVQPGIKSPYTDEASAFIERQIVEDLGLRVGYLWKRQARLWDLIDLARPRDLWTVPVS